MPKNYSVTYEANLYTAKSKKSGEPYTCVELTNTATGEKVRTFDRTVLMDFYKSCMYAPETENK